MFFLKAVGVNVAIGIGGIILFSLIGMAWYAWGALGSLLFFFLLLIGGGWLYDRSHNNKSGYDDLSA